MKKIKKIIDLNKKKIFKYLNRRPHRSFQRTRRRDYVRSLNLPGYFEFNKYVRKTLWKNRKTFLLLTLVYAILTVIMVGIASQDLYLTIKNTLNITSGDSLSGFWGEAGKTGLLFLTAITGGFSQSLTEGQQIYAGIIALLAWLTTVWLLRNILAGYKVKLRDGLYSAGAPLLSTLIVTFFLVIQLLPIALAFLAYSAASVTGLLNSGVEAMLFWIVESLLAVLSLYFITSTLFALIIVTLPGVYPYQAIKTAGDLVVGRRLRILFRFLWMILGVAITWLIVMLPTILLDSWIKNVFNGIDWIPTIPVVLLLLSSLTIVWISSYVYLLYRKVVDDESEPA